MQAASQNQLAAFIRRYRSNRFIPWSGAGRGHFMHCRCLACAGHFGKHAERVFGNQGLCRAVIGGFGSLPGALLGGLIIGLAEPFAAAYLPEIKNIVAYLIMFVVLWIRPEGLFASLYQKKFDRCA